MDIALARPARPARLAATRSPLSRARLIFLAFPRPNTRRDPLDANGDDTKTDANDASDDRSDARA